ncbi:MAG: outer membrane beta-barrel protein [Bacteroidota bacterium]|nr:outer membrane beta-barrel protein [Bacteroidota bacterium]
MANGNANIDLLFRNGLKDLEVLPPVGTWGTIYPIIRKKQRPYILLRSAAVIAVLMSISFLVYRWGHEASVIRENPFIAVNENLLKPANRQSAASADKSQPARHGKQAQNNEPVVTYQPDASILAQETGQESVDLTLLPAPGIMSERNFLISDNTHPLLSFQSLVNTSSPPDSKQLEGISYEAAKEKVNKWSLTAMASPTFYLNPVTGSTDISKQMNSLEQSQLSYSGGVGLAYKISKKLSIQSGLYYSSIGQEVNGISSFTGFAPYDNTKGDHNFGVLTANGMIYTSNPDVFLRDRSGDRVLTRFTNDVFDPAKANLSYMSGTLYQNFSYLEMPVILRYKFIDRAFDFNIIGGLSYNLLVNNTVQARMGGAKYDVGTTQLNPFMVSSSLGMGMEYSLSEKFSLNLEPTFRYYLNPFGSMPGIKVHPYSFGIFSGLSFKF